MTKDSKPAVTPYDPSEASPTSPSDASATCPSKQPSTTPPAGSTNALTAAADGDPKIDDAAAAAALQKIGVSATPVSIQAYRTVGKWQAQNGITEVALGSTHKNEDCLAQAMDVVQHIMHDNPDDDIKIKAVGQLATLVKTRINNMDLSLKCAETLKAAAEALKAPGMNRAPQFNINITQAQPEKEAIPA